MGRSTARVQKVQRGRFLRWMGLGPRVLKFNGPLGPKGCGIAAFAAMHFINRPPWVVDAF